MSCIVTTPALQKDVFWLLTAVNGSTTIRELRSEPSKFEQIFAKYSFVKMNEKCNFLENLLC